MLSIFRSLTVELFNVYVRIYKEYISLVQGHAKAN